MKLIKLQGGLGNQMFQYAVVRAVEKNPKREIYLDLTHFEDNRFSKEGFTARVYELSIFNNLRAQILGQNIRRLLLSKKKISEFFKLIFGLKLHTVAQVENELVQIPNKKNLYLSGFFQSEKYFKHIKPDLCEDFIFPELDVDNERLRQDMARKNTVSIHIRRGDYIKSKAVTEYHGVLSLEYYKEAISYLQKNVEGDLFFYIFSEDAEFVENEFSFLESYQYVGNNKGQDSWKDMCLMKNCNHHIIANSSFSWWGAWLSEREGITIAPDEWFNRKNVRFEIDDFVPSDWVLI